VAPQYLQKLATQSLRRPPSNKFIYMRAARRCSLKCIYAGRGMGMRAEKQINISLKIPNKCY